MKKFFIGSVICVALAIPAGVYADQLIDSAVKLVGDDKNHVDVSPTNGGAPAIVWTSNGKPSAYIGSAESLMTLASINKAQMLISSSGNMTLTSHGNIDLDAKEKLQVNGKEGKTVEIKYVKHAESDGSGGVRVDMGTMEFTNGILTNLK